MPFNAPAIFSSFIRSFTASATSSSATGEPPRVQHLIQFDATQLGHDSKISSSSQGKTDQRDLHSNRLVMNPRATETELPNRCNYSFKSLQETVPQGMDNIRLEMIRNFERNAWRYTYADHQGREGHNAVDAAKKYKSRRKVRVNMQSRKRNFSVFLYVEFEY